MAKKEKKKKLNRRSFIDRSFRISIGIGLAGLGGVLTKKSLSKEYVWQLDPEKCIQCGRCATECVMTLSAVKCFVVRVKELSSSRWLQCSSLSVKARLVVITVEPTS